MNSEPPIAEPPIAEPAPTRRQPEPKEIDAGSGVALFFVALLIPPAGLLTAILLLCTKQPDSGKAILGASVVGAAFWIFILFALSFIMGNGPSAPMIYH